MARRRSTRFVRPSKLTKMWIGASFGPATVPALTAQLFSILSAGALLLRPFTILRTRFDLTVESDQVLVTERPSGSYGKIIVTDSAAAAGATAIPDPSTDPEADWFVYQGFNTTMIVGPNGYNEGIFPDAVARWQVDSKAMRKVGPDDNVVSMVTNISAAGLILGTSGRMLIQLH